MTIEEMLTTIHALGFSVSANVWRTEGEVLVQAWPDAIAPPWAYETGPTLTVALTKLLEVVLANAVRE